ncbi:hypothetical protein BP6252_03315 [Coleophoma cylindrospora]|uniref:CCHC-type domain-containing protein n=1 Tax=Coleophoma cylindrospora TaxID=1849047 RepID=A0A3D8S7D8_9HELO|nr:hypothetical protein BP6252_03315 [Coleophoma cylindrospora]
MPSSPDDNADSRTSGVGRKRALERESLGNNTIDDSDDDAFPPQKRVKADSVDADDDPSFIEAGVQSRKLSTDESQIPSAPQTNPSSSDTAGLPSSTWNQSVQSGLRTSFGRKKASPLQSRPIPVETQEVTPPAAVEATLSRGASFSTPDLPVADEHDTEAESETDVVNTNVEKDGSNTNTTSSDCSLSAAANASHITSDGKTKKGAKLYAPYLRKLRAEVQNSDIPIPKKAIQAEARALTAGPPEEAEKAIRSFVQRYQQQTETATETKVSKKAAKKALKPSFPNAIVPQAAIPRTTEYDGLSEIIDGFRTHPGSSRQYRNRDGVYYLREIVTDSRTEPIKLEQLSFRIFIPLFVWDNLETLCSNLNKLNVQMFSGAFACYVSAFYDKKNMALEEKIRAEGKDESARTISQGMIAAILEEAYKAKGVPSRTPSLWEKLIQVIDKTQADPPLPLAKVEMTAGAEVMETHASAAPTTAATVAPTPSQSETGVESSDDEHSHAAEETQMGAAIARQPTHEDIMLQEKYFPVPSGQEVLHLCLACAASGHHVDTCPSMVCKKCGARNHPALFCPQNKRCGKCRDLGHERSECPEKLLAARTEAVPCDLCKSVEHIESACPILWRSFQLSGEVKKIHELQIHCFCCGGTGHYGLDCGLHKGPVLSGHRTWSKTNWVQFVDFNSKERALSAGVDYSIKPKQAKGFNIKGRANDPIELDDSEEDSSSFIRPKINSAPARQSHIKFGGQNRNDDYPPRGNGYDGRIATQAMPRSGRGYRDESARYGREREFSPPPRFEEDRYFQAGNFEHEYRQPPQSYPQQSQSFRPTGSSHFDNPPRQPSTFNSSKPISIPLPKGKNSNKRRKNAPVPAPGPGPGAKKARSRKGRGGNARGGMNGRN